LFIALAGFGCRDESPAPETKPLSSDRKLTGTIVAERLFQIGSAGIVEGPSPSTEFAAVFEDDGKTGVFYAVNPTETDSIILDALFVYNVEAVADREEPSQIQILWSGDGRKTALLINGYPHAVFDFAAQRGYCRTGFPPADPQWTKFSHAWDDAALDLFAD
jgi:hypothetical protein